MGSRVLGDRVKNATGLEGISAEVLDQIPAKHQDPCSDFDSTRLRLGRVGIKGCNSCFRGGRLRL